VRLATVFAGLPNPWQGGGPLTHWAILSTLAGAGHDVAFVSLPWEDGRRDAQRIAALRDLGVGVVLLDAPTVREPPGERWRARRAYARTLLWPPDDALFPTAEVASALSAAIGELEPDVVLAHGTPAVSAGYRLPLPSLALISDPPGLSRRLRTLWDPLHPWRLGREELIYRLGAASYAFHADRRMIAMLRRFDSVAVFGAHRVRWARRQGVSAWYARSPIVDAAGAHWRQRRARLPANPRPRILMIGHLRGISTISGLHVFGQHVLPQLTRALGAEGFEVHVVGDYEPPPSLQQALDHPAVRLRGHVEPPDDEFLRADVILVPTPIETGPRVRILTGMSFGSCVVAHEANRLGIPALADGENCLLAGSEDLGQATLRALRDPALRTRLGEAGRRLYESRFTPETAGQRIVGELEGLAASGPSGRPFHPTLA
jgi:glycosyltransferase involved in cell wall biosynthesis